MGLLLNLLQTEHHLRFTPSMTTNQNIQLRQHWSGFGVSFWMPLNGPALKSRLEPQRTPVERPGDGSSDTPHPIWETLRGYAKKNGSNCQVHKACAQSLWAAVKNASKKVLNKDSKHLCKWEFLMFYKLKKISCYIIMGRIISIIIKK